MLVDRDQLPEIWSTVKASAHENPDTPTVLLLASHSIDSIAACTILQRLLEDEGITRRPHQYYRPLLLLAVGAATSAALLLRAQSTPDASRVAEQLLKLWSPVQSQERCGFVGL